MKLESRCLSCHNSIICDKKSAGFTSGAFLAITLLVEQDRERFQVGKI